MIQIISVITSLLIIIFYFAYLESAKQSTKKNKNNKFYKNDKIHRDDLINIINFYKKDYGEKYKDLISILKISNMLLMELKQNDISTNIFYIYFTPYIRYMEKKKILSKKEIDSIISDLNNINILMKLELEKKLISEDTIAKIEFKVIQNEVKMKLEMNNLERKVNNS